MIVPRSPRFSLWPTKLGFVSSTNLARPFRGLVCISVDDPPLISPLQTHRRRRPAGSAQAALDSDTADFDARNAPTPISCSPLARLGPPAASFPTRHSDHQRWTRTPGFEPCPQVGQAWSRDCPVEISRPKFAQPRRPPMLAFARCSRLPGSNGQKADVALLSSQF